MELGVKRIYCLFEATMLDEVSGGKDPKAETCCRIQIVCDCALVANQASGRPVPAGNDMIAKLSCSRHTLNSGGKCTITGS